MKNQRKKFEKIYNKHVEKIYRFVFVKVGSQAVAEDITSQVFTKGWHKFRKTNPGIKNPNAYLYQVARAEVANYYRDRTKLNIITAEAGEIADVSPSPEDVQQSQSEIDNLMRHLNQLSWEHQDVLVWRYIDRLSHKEIGQIVEKSEGAVRVMVHRALKELREKMGQ